MPEERETILHNPAQPIAAGDRQHLTAHMPKMFWLICIGALQTLEGAMWLNSHDSAFHTSWKSPACSGKLRLGTWENTRAALSSACDPRPRCKCILYVQVMLHWLQCRGNSSRGAACRVCVWGLLCQCSSASLPRDSSTVLCCSLFLTPSLLLTCVCVGNYTCRCVTNSYSQHLHTE